MSRKIKTEFIPDNAVTKEEKNNMLSQYLSGGWNDLAIVNIVRKDEGSPARKGWEVSYIEP